MNSKGRKPKDKTDLDFIGAEIATHRAGKRARQRTAEVARAAELAPEMTDEQRTTLDGHGPRELSFSQAQDYEDIPGMLKLEELPKSARTRIYNVLYASIEQSKESVVHISHLGFKIGGNWEIVLRDKHIYHDNRPLDQWKNQIQNTIQQLRYTRRGEDPLDEFNSGFNYITDELKHSIETLPFHKVFDMVQYIIRHPKCPSEVITSMKQEFANCRLAYTIDTETPPTIIPAVNEEEGNTIVCSLQTLRQSGLDASTTHLRAASESINRGDWADSVRESIHAVESVARQIAPEASNDLKKALALIEKSSPFHPAFKQALTKLYGYTSDEQGIRHALLDRETADVGMDEAVFMLGACASFASYLARKHAALNQSD